MRPGLQATPWEWLPKEASRNKFSLAVFLPFPPLCRPYRLIVGPSPGALLSSGISRARPLTYSSCAHASFGARSAYSVCRPSLLSSPASLWPGVCQAPPSRARDASGRREGRRGMPEGRHGAGEGLATTTTATTEGKGKGKEKERDAGATKASDWDTRGLRRYAWRIRIETPPSPFAQRSGQKLLKIIEHATGLSCMWMKPRSSGCWKWSVVVYDFALGARREPLVVVSSTAQRHDLSLYHLGHVLSLTIAVILHLRPLRLRLRVFSVDVDIGIFPTCPTDPFLLSALLCQQQSWYGHWSNHGRNVYLAKWSARPSCSDHGRAKSRDRLSRSIRANIRAVNPSFRFILVPVPLQYYSASTVPMIPSRIFSLSKSFLGEKCM